MLMFRVKPCTQGGFTVKAAVTVLAEEAEIVIVWAVLTGLVVIVNVADVWPAGITTLAGTTPAELFEESVTTTEFTGAGLATVTVPVELEPPTTMDGFTLSPATVPSDGGVSVIPSVAVTLFAEVAVITAL